MPLIQRNLFPARPSPKHGDGPSVLRGAGVNTGFSNSSTVITNPNLTLNPNHKYNKQQSSDSNNKTKGNNSKYYDNGGNRKKDANNNNNNVKKLRKSQSASMISLLAINNPINNGNNNNNRKNHHQNLKVNYDSQDSFNSSDASTSDPNSLCSSSSSVDNNNNNHHLKGADTGMISRRRILSRSRDALNNGTTSDDYCTGTGYHGMDQDDVWFDTTKLVSDHVDEIVTKWDQIEDEIWAKVICMERNRRVAKAYARAPILTINGSDTGFDGHRIGLNGFDNPMRDKKVADIKNKIGEGVKIFMDENGSLLVKKLTDSDVFLLSLDKMDNFTSEKIDARKSVVLFDMKQYHNELLREIKSSSPNARTLEKRCFCFLSFSTVSEELLTTPVWMIVINLVALEMLIKLLPNRIIEDDFYSLPVTLFPKNNSQYSPVPPKLPPRDLHNKKPPLTLPEPDYDDDDEPEVINVIPKIKHNPRIDDDPYFYGLSAHVPKFAHSNQNSSNNKNGYPVAEPRLAQNRASNPPIVRKAMNKKLWPSSNNNSQPPPAPSMIRPPYQYHPLDHFAGQFRSYNGPNVLTATKHTGPMTFDPMRMTTVYSMPRQQHQNRIADSSDNNEIYGVNPSLLRKNTLFYMRSTSSPSLKNIFSRKKKTHAATDVNNNPRLH